MRARNGQVALYLVMTLVVILLLTLLNVDTFLAVRGKGRAQNAGDAATLAAAHQQANLLNDIGRLNIEHLVAAARDNWEACDQIERAQRRLALLGPVEGLRLADEAARKNGMVPRAEFSAILKNHVLDVRNIYAMGSTDDADDPYRPSYPGAWEEYARAIEDAIVGGLATGPDNIEFYYAAGGHLLMNPDFYDAIAGRNWCWFHFHAENLLSAYSDYHDWDPLPFARKNTTVNSEIFSLHVEAVSGAFTNVFPFTYREVCELVRRYSGEMITEADLVASTLMTNTAQVWFRYDDYAWHTWFEGLHLAGDEDEFDFPLVGEIKEPYNVLGAAAACRCINNTPSTVLNSARDISWVAAAKPFGSLDDLNGERVRADGVAGFVLPCFEAVRLVAVDTIGSANLRTADYDWVRHIRDDLAPYLSNGPTETPGSRRGCYYCQQLFLWEQESFRKSGINWLKFNAGSCHRGTTGSAHGGSSHGH